MAKIPINKYPNQAGYTQFDTDRNIIETMSDGMFRSMNTPESWINVKDFGAKGDGVTDDTEAIRNAINQIDENDVLFFPKGTYLLTPQPINILLTKKLLIKGENKYNTIIKQNGTTGEKEALFSFSTYVNGTIENITFEGNSTYLPPSHLYELQENDMTVGDGIGLYFLGDGTANDDFKNLEINNCQFKKFTNAAIEFNHISKTANIRKIQNSNFEYNYQAVAITNNSEYVFQLNNNYKQNYIAIYHKGGANPFIANNNITVNFIGIYQTQGSSGRGGHGDIVYNKLNHNTIIFLFDSIRDGDNFEGNTCFYGKYIIKGNQTGYNPIRIKNNYLIGDYEITGNNYILIENNIFGGMTSNCIYAPTGTVLQRNNLTRQLVEYTLN